MALAILLSFITPLICIDSFAAADGEFTGDIYVDISQNANLQSIVANKGRLVVLSGNSGDTEVGLKPTGIGSLYTAKGTFSTSIKIKGDPQPADGTRRVYLDLTKSIENGEVWSNPTVYCWGPITRSSITDWPGASIEHLYGNYYFCDNSAVHDYSQLLFDSGEDSAQYQTVDLYISGWTASTPMFRLGDKVTDAGRPKYNGEWVAVDGIEIETAAFNLSERDSNTSNKITIDASGAGTWSVYDGPSLEDLASESVDYTVAKDNFSDQDIINSSGGVEILGVDATYYDYLSDVERSGGWRTQTYGKDGDDTWKRNNPFQKFNKELDQYYKVQTAAQTETWGIPLYFGNFYPTLGGSTSANTLLNLAHGFLTNNDDDKRYFLAAQNSNYLNLPSGQTLDVLNIPNDERYRQAYQGLVYNKLVNGKLMVGDSGKIVAPWFNNEWLQDDPGDGQERTKIVKAKFPFIGREIGGNITEYSFHSSGTSGTEAKDNVYFTWDGNNGAPLQVNYGQGVRYGIKGSDNNFGVFPFNVPNGSGNQTESGINYGFGVKMEMEFYLPENGKYSNGESAKFKFSADDDLWVFVDDELVLDVGGNHCWCDADIDFGSENGDHITGTVNRVFAEYNSNTKSVIPTYNGNIQSKKKEVYINTSNVNKKHKMTIFYMERGLGSSNFKAVFSMIPATSDLSVRNTVDVSEINEGLQQQVQNLGVFDYTATQTQSSSEPKSKTVDNIGHNGEKRFDTGEFVKSTDANMTITQKEDSNKSIRLSYDTTSEIIDQMDGSSQNASGDSRTFSFINKSNNPNDAVDFKVNFTNTFKAAPLYLKKEVENKYNEYSDHDSTEHDFKYKISVKLDGGEGDDGFIFPKGLAYDYLDAEGNTSGTSGSTGDNGCFSIKNGDCIMFGGMPVGAEVKIEEIGNPDLDTYTVGNISVNGTTEENKNMVSFDIRDTTGGNNVVYTNLYNVAVVNLTATKNFNGEPYDNSKEENKNKKAFKFTVTPEKNDSSGKDPDFLAGKGSETTSVDNGAVQFDPIALKKTGRYIYKISEGFSEEVPTEEQGFYAMDKKIYYAQVDVDKDPTTGELSPSVKYYEGISSDSTKYECTDPINSGIVWNNSKLCVTVRFTKVDESGNGLSGVNFKVYSGGIGQYLYELYTKDALGNQVGEDGVVTSGPNGVVEVANMAYSTDKDETIYHFVEEKALKGYQLLTSRVTVKIYKDGTYELFTLNSDRTRLVPVKDAKITNYRKPELPATGGVGVVLLYIFGSIIVVGSGLAYVLYKKKINPISAIRTFLRK